MGRNHRRIKDHEFIPDGDYLIYRVIVMEHLGRMLKSWEIVHHVNNDPSDNRIENLQVMTRAEHQKHHHQKKVIKRPYKRMKVVRGHRLIPDGRYNYNRIVMMEHLGRILKPSEYVYRINGDTSDDRIENLTLRKKRS